MGNVTIEINGNVTFSKFPRTLTAVYEKYNVDTSPNNLCLLLYSFDFNREIMLTRTDRIIFLANMKVHVSLWKFPKMANNYVH